MPGTTFQREFGGPLPGVEVVKLAGSQTSAGSALASAITYVNTLSAAILVIPPGTWVVDSVPPAITCPIVLVQGTGTLQLGPGMIVNTDGGYNNHVCLLDFRGPTFLEVQDITLDGNRANQTYPSSATGILLGSGANGYRDNGLLRVTALDANTAAGTIAVYDVTVKNAYLNGLAFIDTDKVTIVGGRYTDCTWNGIAFAGVDNFSAYGAYYLRCGVSSTWTVAKMPAGSDRAAIQCRGRASDWTANGQGYPVITSRVNGKVTVEDCKVELCGVEGLYFRAVRDLKVIGNTVIDPGNGVADAYAFRPAGIWYEWVLEALVEGNTVELTTAPTYQPDGMVGYTMEDTDGSTAAAGDPVLLTGPGHGVYRDNKIHWRRAYPVAAASRQFYRGYRVNSHHRITGGHIRNCVYDAVYASNSSSFVAERLQDVTIHDIRIEDCKRVVEFTQYSGGQGVGSAVVSALLVKDVSFSVMYDADGTSEDAVLVWTPASWLTVDVDLTVDGLRGDATNAGGTFFTVSRIRGSANSKISHKRISVENFINGFEVYNFARAFFKDIELSAGAIAFRHLASTGAANSGAFIIADFDGYNLTSAPITLVPGSQTLDQLFLQGFRAISSTNIGLISGLDTTKHLHVVADQDVVAGASNSISATLTRSLSADTGNAAVTLNPRTSPRYVRFGTALTANRAVTLSTTGARNGDWFEITREVASTGAFTVDVGSGPLKSLAAGTWCIVRYDGSAWRLRTYGAL